ncbi:bone morphogenetic protein 15 [Lates japonicus]|uniref:Bone morphogenetic protein 15 n=1 Tax=Lates japonicus TaxID=270547 RepID=A0AAD3RBU2_LATJO|nr:bone morphogenetic protein 15 [Lates japonicus]
MTLLRLYILSCFILSLCSTCTGVVPGRKMASHQSAKHTGAHHRPLTDEQRADQNVQFMLSLYRSAAEPDGRPKQYRKFGSNTVRLLRPSASSVHYLPASKGEGASLLISLNICVLPLHTSQYHCNLDLFPQEQLIRVSFIHLRSSSIPLPPPQLKHHPAEPPALSPDLAGSPDRSGHPGPTSSGPRADITGPSCRKDGRGGLPTLWPSIGARAEAARSAPKNRCKLHSFRLSFDELGWGHYFIAPPVYNPRFCQGDCPRVLHYGYHSPNHAIIQTVINDLGVGDVPPPSCVPYKYMPMSVLVVHKKEGGLGSWRTWWPSRLRCR